MGQFTTPLPGELVCPYSARRPPTIHGVDFDSIRGVYDECGSVESTGKAADNFLGLASVPLHAAHEAHDGEKLFRCKSDAPCYRNQAPVEPCEPRVRSYSATHPRNAKPPTAPNRPMSSNPPADASNPAAHWVARNISRPASAKRRPASAQGRQGMHVLLLDPHSLWPRFILREHSTPSSVTEVRTPLNPPPSPPHDGDHALFCYYRVG